MSEGQQHWQQQPLHAHRARSPMQALKNVQHTLAQYNAQSRGSPHVKLQVCHAKKKELVCIQCISAAVVLASAECLSTLMPAGLQGGLFALGNRGVAQRR